MKSHLSIIAYYRKSDKDLMLVIGSFSDQNIIIGIPGKSIELLLSNDDAVQISHHMEIPLCDASILRIGE